SFLKSEVAFQFALLGAFQRVVNDVERALLLLADGIRQLVVVVPRTADEHVSAVALQNVVNLVLGAFGVRGDLVRVEQKHRFVSDDRHCNLSWWPRGFRGWLPWIEPGFPGDPFPPWEGGQPRSVQSSEFKVQS